MRGIDVSVYQGNIDWAKVKAAGIAFAYAKATEGTHYTDAQFTDNHDDCATAGIPFGAYHFLRFGTDPVIQAQHFLQVTQNRLGPLVPMVDVEGGGQDGVTDVGSLVKTLAAFNEVVEQAIGQKIIIYSDYGDWNGMMGGSTAFAGHPLWIAEYNNDPSPTLPNGFHDYAIWQYSSGGVLPGVGGYVDLDRLNPTLTLAAISRRIP